jgi:putative sigma-54 modulation protein
MTIKFTAKGVKITGAQKAFTEKQLKRIEKISGDIMNAEVIVTHEKLNYRVEIAMKTKLNSYHIENSDPILKQALRTNLNILKSQAKKNKEKLKKDRQRTGRLAAVKRSVSRKLMETGMEAQPDKITVSNNFSKKPMSVEEAIFFLKESKENAYLFTNAETSKMAVVFFDKGNKISIIEEN